LDAYASIADETAASPTANPVGKTFRQSGVKFMMNHPRATYAAVWLAALGIGVPGLDGGSAPSELPASLPLRVSPAVVEFGKSIDVRGASRVKPGSQVKLSFQPSSGGVIPMKSTRASRTGVWHTKYRPGSPGIITATVAGLGAGAASGASLSSVRIRSNLVVTPPSALGRSRAVSVRVLILPKLRQTVWLEIHSGRHWKIVSTRQSNPKGQVAFKLNAVPKGALRVRTAASSGFEGGSRRFRVASLRPAGASWYGLYGDPVACGGVLHMGTIGVAHKTLPCGTLVTVRYRGRTVVAPVIDRGPYIAGREFDLSGALAKALHFDGVDTIWVSP